MSDHENPREPREKGDEWLGRADHGEAMSDDDRAWLESDLSRLSEYEPYEWAEGELEAGGEDASPSPGQKGRRASERDVGDGRKDHERLKRGYPRLFEELARVFARQDPLGLVGTGAPEDGYEPEVGTILPRLGAVASEGGRRWTSYTRNSCAGSAPRWRVPGSATRGPLRRSGGSGGAKIEGEEPLVGSRTSVRGGALGDAFASLRRYQSLLPGEPLGSSVADRSPSPITNPPVASAAP